ncbi:MAG: ABC transporter permease [Spirochaetaceae bacterium]
MNKTIKYILLLCLLTFTFLFIFNIEFTGFILKSIFPGIKKVMHPRLILSDMFIEHIVLVLLSSISAIIVGLSLGIFVTRDTGKNLLELVESLISIMQTFPPAAVLALSVPALGYGFAPAFTALFIYSIFPIVSNTIAGINAVDKSVIEASKAIGMDKMQVLLKVEIPLSIDIILAGIRTTVVINVGTAAIAAVVAGGGLGSLIISGLIDNNISYIFTGAILTALLALGFDTIFTIIDKIKNKRHF